MIILTLFTINCSSNHKFKWQLFESVFISTISNYTPADTLESEPQLHATNITKKKNFLVVKIDIKDGNGSSGSNNNNDDDDNDYDYKKPKRKVKKTPTLAHTHTQKM